MQTFETILSHINNIWDGPVIICGDTNIDTLSASSARQQYIDLLNVFDLTNVVTKPTRHGKSLIDHLITNIPGKVTLADVIPCDTVSDHDCPFMNINIKTIKFQPRQKSIRDFKSFNLSDFKSDFAQLPFSTIYTFEDPNEQLSVFNSLILGCLNVHAPIKTCKMTRPPAPWMRDLKITTLQKEAKQLRVKAHRTENDEDWKEYRSTKNKLKKEIKSTKSRFYKKAFSSRRPKEVWQTIHRILKPNSKPIAECPDSLNKYYNGVAERLTSSKRTTIEDLKVMINELSHLNENAFKLQPTSYNDVRKTLNTIRSDCSTGHDSIPINLLKPVSEFIISPLNFIINNFISFRTFPEYWKVARISPVPKLNNPSSPSDFRPISVLPLLSKVYERVVLQQLVFHIENLMLYKSTQHGFRKSHSTTSCLMKLKDYIINAMNKGEITISVFTDYSKAFDTIDFKRLLRKLTNLNIDKSFLHWMTNHLSDRQHYVQIDNKKSSMLTVGFGVSQGSILGPVTFNLYVPDLSQQVKYSKTLQYADDTKIYIHSKPNELEAKSIELSRDIENIRN